MQYGPQHDTFWTYKIWYVLINQWVQSGAELGWNPFSGAGQPLALFNNYFLHARVFVISKIFIVSGVKFSGDDVFAFSWLFYHLDLCVWSTMLFVALTGRLKESFIGMMAILFGGLFWADMVQPAGVVTIYNLAPILFFTVLIYKTRRMEWLPALALVGGISLNYYVPVYTALSLVALGAGWFIAGAGSFKEKLAVPGNILRELLARPIVIAISLAVFAVAAAPMVYSYAEMGDFISPSRGFRVRGAVSAKKTGFQASVSAPLLSYVNISDPFEKHDGKYFNYTSFLKDGYGGVFQLPHAPQAYSTHTSFYIGVAPVIGFVIALFYSRIALAFAIGAGVLIFLGMGSEFPVWRFLVDYVPMVNMARHTFFFARAVTFLVIVASVFGFVYISDDRAPLRKKIWGIALGGGIAFAITQASTLNSWGAILTTLSMVVLLLLTGGIAWVKNTAKILVFAALLLIYLADVGLFSYNALGNSWDNQSTYSAQELEYPVNWETGNLKASGKPFDLTPILLKDSVWLHKDPNFMFQLQKDFAKFAINNKLTESHTSGPTFVFVPGNGRNDPDALAWETLTRIFGGTFQPDYETTPIVSGNPNEIRISTNAPVNGYILRLENYHKGWSAYVDETPAVIKKVYPNFQMIEVPAGAHIIDFKFRSAYDAIVKAHLTLVIIGWLLTIWWLWRWKDEETTFLV